MNDGWIRGKRVLVTGGAGVIGRELLKLLVTNGGNVLSVDRSPLPKGDWRGIVHVQKDLAADSLKELQDFQPEIVFHLAATFERSNESPAFWMPNWRDNVSLSHRLVEIIQELQRLEAFVFASSYLIYSPSLYLSPELRDEAVALKEDDPVEPRNLCGAAKYYTEKELEFVRGNVNSAMRTVYARIFRVYGCGSRDVISRWMRAALDGNGVEVYNRYNRFDFIFAADVAQGLLKLSATPNAEGPINLGCGLPRSIEQVLEIIQKYSSRALQIGERDSGEPYEASCADVSRLKELTDWIPAIDLEQGIETVAKYERQRAEYHGTHG